LDERTYPLGEVIHRRIDERYHQYFLIGSDPSVRDELRSKRRKSEGLTGTRHGGDTQLSTVVSEDLFLRGARNEISYKSAFLS
jgi:hypothetical protein